MKRILLIASLIFSIGFLSQSQRNELIIIKIKSQLAKYCPEDFKIKVNNTNGTYKGRFKIIFQNSILIKSDTILLSDIYDIMVNTPTNILVSKLVFLGGIC
jgi:hypothetical protein